MSTSSLRSVLRSPSLLRHALLGDAIASGATGVLLAAAAAPLAGVLGLPESLLRLAGASLLPFAAIVAWLGARGSPPRAAVWAVVAYNAMWVVESFALLLFGWYAPTTLGVAFLVAQAMVVAVFAELQVYGLRAARTAPG